MSIESVAPPAVAVRRRPQQSTLRRSWRRRPVNRALVLLHRWPALILGLFLVRETTSGAALLYHADVFRATNSGLYQHHAGTPVDSEQALRAVVDGTTFPASWAGHDDGVFVVGDNTYTELYFVDPESGHINGHTNLDKGFWGWMINLHDCGFTCDGLPWYSAWLAHPVWAGGPSFLTGITWGGLILGVLGCLMILLVLSSLKIWWPGIRRLGARFTVRRGKGRFARDYDLHNVIGAIGLPFVLMWAVTGAGLEFPGVEKAWLAITGGATAAEPSFDLTPTKVPAGTPAVTFARATDIAPAKVPGTVVGVGGAVLVIELGLLVQATLAIAGLARGHRPGELSTFLAYLVFSLVALPVAVAQVRGDAGRWAGAVVSVALLVQAVVVIRTQTSWRAA